MRREPTFIHGIAGEAAAKMIVDAPLAHARKRELDRPEIAPVLRALARPPQEFEQHGLWEFWSAAHAAVNGIDHASDLVGRAVQFGYADHRLALWVRFLGKARHQRA